MVVKDDEEAEMEDAKEDAKEDANKEDAKEEHKVEDVTTVVEVLLVATTDATMAADHSGVKTPDTNAIYHP